MEFATPAQPTTFHTPDSQDRARAYKSRNKRPCDFCRYKKAACHLDVAPPCELCQRYGKECTFVQSPAKRRRPNEDQRLSASLQPGQQPLHQQTTLRQSLPLNGVSGLGLNNELMNWDPNSGPFFPGISSEFDFTAVPYEAPGYNQFTPVDPAIATGPTTPVNAVQDTANAEDPSLDNQIASSAHFAGLSGESDPYLLRYYQYNQNQECNFQQLRIRRVGQNNGIPVHFLIQQNKHIGQSQNAEGVGREDYYRAQLKEMVSADVGRRLIRLFFRYIQPYFPILSKQRSLREGETDPERLSTCLLAAVYGHALPFCIFDDQLCKEMYTPPSADDLFKIAWAATGSFHTPSLAVVQTLLLLVQRWSSNSKSVTETPPKHILMCNCTSIAQALGLHLDPNDWQLPIWEQRLRRRLSWAIFCEEKWMSLNSGRSSHLNADDWAVEMITPADFSEFDEDRKSTVSEHFLQLCTLSQIVNDILRDMFSVKATRKLSNSLELTLEMVKPLRMRLTQWYQTLPPRLAISRHNYTAHELNGHGALHLAYMTAKIELFRAMLRPKVEERHAAAGSALRVGAIAVAKEVVELLGNLDASHLEAFWPTYSRTNFIIASNFMLLLFSTSPNPSDASECFKLLSAWRSLLRIKSRSCNMLNMALHGLDGTFVAGMDRLIDLSPAALQVFREQSVRDDED